jgi:hypothetical protein
MGTDGYEAERVARIRYEAALSEFLKRLEAGQAKAAALNTDTGKIYPIGVEVWRTNRARDYLTKGKGPAGDYYRNRTRYFYEGPLLIERQTNEASQAVRSGIAGLPAAPAAARKRGPKFSALPRVKSEMLRYGVDKVDHWSEDAMAAQFDANRETCRKALAELKAELANK